MNSRSTPWFPLFLSFAILAGCARRDGGQEGAPDAFRQANATPEAVSLARRVIDAHGGIEAWRAAKTLRYTQTLLIPGGDKPWVATETVEETPVRRLYQDWSSHGGSLVWDGKEVWAVDWGLPNPPKLMPFLNYYSLITPWLALDEGVTIEASSQALIPGGDSTKYDTVTIRVPSDISGPPVAGYYRVLIDPTSNRMKAMSYSVTYGPILDAMGVPDGVTEMGPITHVYDEYTTVGGLLVPTRYHTVGPDGSLAGDHQVGGWGVGAAFDESRMVKPTNAVVDTSSFNRRNATSRS